MIGCKTLECSKYHITIFGRKKQQCTLAGRYYYLKVSNDGRRKLVGIDSSWMSLVNDDQPEVGLVSSSSLDYCNSRCISFKH